MRFSAIHIDSFGEFTEFSFDEIPPGLSVVIGDNEAGKTTILNFIRSILFGFPKRNQKAYYPPRNAGRKRGRILLLNDKNQTTIVERVEGKGVGPLKVAFSDGSEGGETALKQLIGSATGDLYQNVFAFSLTELQSLEALQNEAVRDAIYSAGIGTGRLTIPQALKQITAEREDIFAPNAQKRRINLLLTDLDNLRHQIREHSGDHAEYQRVRGELNNRIQELHDSEIQLRKARIQFDRLKSNRDSWTDWIELETARERLDRLPEIDSFPQDGISRLDRILSHARQLNVQLADIDAEREVLDSSLSEICIDGSLIEASAEIQSLLRGQRTFEDALQELPRKQIELKLASSDVESLLRELGSDWNENTVMQFDFSVSITERIEHHRKKLDTAEEHRMKCQTRLETEDALLVDALQIEKATLTERDGLADSSGQFDQVAIEQLVKQRQNYEDATNRDLPKVSKTCEMLVDQLDDALKQIDPKWDESTLLRLDTSHAIKDEIRAQQTASISGENDLRNADQKHQELMALLSQLDAELTQHKSALDELGEPPHKDLSNLEDRQRKLRTLDLDLVKATQLKDRLEHLSERSQDLEAQSERIANLTQSNTAVIPPWLGPTVVLVGLVAMPLLGFGRNDWITGVSVFGVSLLICVLFLVVRKQVASTNRQQFVLLTRDAATIKKNRDGLREELEMQQQSLLTLQDDIERQSNVLQLDSCGDRLQIVESEAEIVRMIEGLVKWETAIEECNQIQQQQVKLQAQVDQAHQQRVLAQAEVAETGQNWVKWIRHKGLPRSVSLSGAIDVISDLRTARERVKTIEAERLRIAQMESFIHEYEDRVQQVVDQNELDVLGASTPGAIVDFLVARTQHANEACRNLKDAQQQRAKIEAKVENARTLLTQANDSTCEAQSSWQETLGSIGLPNSLTVGEALRLLARVERARDRLFKYRKLIEYECVLSQSASDYHQQACQIAERTGRAIPEFNQTAATVSQLETDLKKNESNLHEQQSQLQGLRNLETKSKSLQVQIDQTQLELRRLLNSAHVEDEEAFRKKSFDFQQRCNLLEKIEMHESLLVRLAGGHDRFGEFIVELASTSLDQLKVELASMEEDILMLEKNARKVADEQGRLNERLQNLESSEELSNLRMEEKAKLAALSDESDKWSVLKLAETLIDMARDKHEKERRPAVLREAERHFCNFTGGRYSRINARSGERHVLAVAPNGTTKQVDQLSRGTAEQLYLALRFGFVQEFARRSTALPLIFDDILVNFDPTRSKLVGQAIVELAKSQQVLLFTCHPTTVELLQDVDKNVPVFELTEMKIHRR